MVKNSQAAVIPAKGYFLEVVSDDGRSQFSVGETGGVGARLYRDGKVFENSNFDITWTIEGSDSLFFVSKKDPKLQRLTAGLNDDGLHAVRFKSDQPSAAPATVRAVIEGHSEATFAWPVRYGGGTQGLTLTPVTLGALDADGISAHQAKAKLTLTGAIPDDTMVQFSLPKDSQAYFTSADNVSPDNKTVAIAVDAQGNSGTVSFVDPRTTGETVTLSATYPAKKILADPLAFRFDEPPHSIAIRSENRIAFVDGRQQHNATAALTESQSTAPVQFNLQLNQSAIFNKGANYVVLPSERTANTAAADAVSPPVNFVDKAITAPLTKTLTVFARHAKANTRDFRFLPPDWLELTPQSQQVPADGIATVTIKALYIIGGKSGKTVTFTSSGDGGRFLETPGVTLLDHGKAASASPDSVTGWTPEVRFASDDEKLTITASAAGVTPVKEPFSFSAPTGPKAIAVILGVNVDDTIEIRGSLKNAPAGTEIQFDLPGEAGAIFIASGDIILSSSQKTAHVKTASGGETPVVRVAGQAGEDVLVTLRIVNSPRTVKTLNFSLPRRFYYYANTYNEYSSVQVLGYNSLKEEYEYNITRLSFPYGVSLYESINYFYIEGSYYAFHGYKMWLHIYKSDDGINFKLVERHRTIEKYVSTSYDKNSKLFSFFSTDKKNIYQATLKLSDINAYGIEWHLFSNLEWQDCASVFDNNGLLVFAATNGTLLSSLYYGSQAKVFEQPVILTSSASSGYPLNCALMNDNSSVFSTERRQTLSVIKEGSVTQLPFRYNCKGLIARGDKLYCFFADGAMGLYDLGSQQLIFLQNFTLNQREDEYPTIQGM